MRNRYYDSQTGRFTQEDPLGLAGGLSAYGFAAGDPISFSDPFGLIAWPPDVHDQLIRFALAGIASEADIVALIQASRKFDKSSQSIGDSYMHAMRAPGQTAQAASAETAKFEKDQLAKAKTEAASGDRAAALNDLGIAMHPMMDATSPYHRDASGNPLPWGWNPPSAAHVVREHFAKPTAAELTASTVALQGAFQQVFGGR